MKKSTTLVLISFCFTAACNNPEGGVEKDSLSDATEDTAVVYQDERGRVAADGAEVLEIDEGFWANVNFDAPVVDDPDLKNSGIETRAEKNYSIYMMEDRVLFDTDKAQIRAEGEEKLQQIADNIKSMPENRQIRIFGHADSRAGKEYNEQLSKDRANAVRKWLTDKGGVAQNRVSVEPMGETAPRATNESARGRQLNRRVAIVVVTQE